jgi:hypothetical protein
VTAPEAAQYAETSAPEEGWPHLGYWAWTILANVSEGHWELQTTEWQEAVVRWRDAFHAQLDLDGSPDA